MKTSRKGITPLQSRVPELLNELASKIAFFVGPKERLLTDVPGLLLRRRTAPTAPVSATYEPSLAVVAQGRKQANLGGTNFIFDQSRYLLTSLDLPVICNVIEASEQVPYLCFVLKLEMPVKLHGSVATRNHDPIARLRIPPSSSRHVMLDAAVADRVRRFRRWMFVNRINQDLIEKGRVLGAKESGVATYVHVPGFSACLWSTKRWGTTFS